MGGGGDQTHHTHTHPPTHLHKETGRGTVQRGVSGEGAAPGVGLQGALERRGGGRLHLGHPVHLAELSHCHVLLLTPPGEGGWWGGGISKEEEGEGDKTEREKYEGR